MLVNLKVKHCGIQKVHDRARILQLFVDHELNVLGFSQSVGDIYITKNRVVLSSRFKRHEINITKRRPPGEFYDHISTIVNWFVSNVVTSKLQEL